MKGCENSTARPCPNKFYRAVIVEAPGSPWFTVRLCRKHYRELKRPRVVQVA